MSWFMRTVLGWRLIDGVLVPGWWSDETLASWCGRRLREREEAEQAEQPWRPGAPGGAV